MVQLNRSMMERYEIADHRPESLRAVIFGADALMLGGIARLLDEANCRGANAGALCITRSAEALNAQDGMFTLLVRGDDEKGGHTSNERVVQSIIAAVNPEEEFEAMLGYAAEPALEALFLPANCDDVMLGTAARFLYARWEKKLPAPALIFVCTGAYDMEGSVEAMAALGMSWSGEFAGWLGEMPVQSMLAETLCGPLGETEIAKARHDMNYRDDFIGWAEPLLRCTAGGDVPQWLQGVCETGDFAQACRRKALVFDSVVFLCASAGYLSGMDTFAQVLRDEKMRAWIGHAFFDEIMPSLPWSREEIAPEVISAFSRLENSMNDMPLMETGRGLLGNFPRTVLPAIRAYADREFEAPLRLSLAFSAAIMIYAGARANDRGEYEILRGQDRRVIHDYPEILEDFSVLSHDMPAESLAYAVLANRAAWGDDLRDIPGLEMRVAFDLSSIQRIGFRETLKIQQEA